MNWIKYLLLIASVCLISLVIMLITEQIAKHYLNLGEPIVYDANPLWGYSPRANRIYTRFNGSVVSINEVGTRSTDSWDKNGKNIIFLGDSITYGGSYLSDSETFPILSCATLRNWKCHNAGVNGYGIISMVARSRYDTRISSAPLRVFTFITDDFDRGLPNSNNAHFILREPPSFFPALWEILNYSFSYLIPKNWFGKNSDIKDKNRLENEKNINRQFALDILLSELRRLEKDKLDFLLFHSPNIAEVNNKNLIKNNKILLKLKQKYPNRFQYLIETIDYEHLDTDESLFIDTAHLSKKGHVEVAKFLSELLNKLFYD